MPLQMEGPCEIIAQVNEAYENYLIVVEKNVKYLIYQDEENYQKNDCLQINGMKTALQKDLELGTFEFSAYLQKKRVFYQIVDPHIIFLSRHESFSQRCIKTINGHLSGSSLQMTNMLLWNKKQEDRLFYQNLQQINAAHLFVVSGFHVSFLYRLFNFFFSFLKKKGRWISIILCAFYIYLLDFSISSLRAFGCLFFPVLFKKKISAADALAIIGLITLLIEPLYVYQYSFIFSYLLAFILILCQKMLRLCTFFTKPLLLSFIGLMSTFPLITQMNYQMNFIGFFTNLVLTPFVFILLIFCLSGLILSPFSGNFFGFVYDNFTKLISLLSKKSGFLLFGHWPSFMVLIYYVLLFFVFLFIEKENVRRFVVSFALIIAMVCGIYYRGYFTFYQQITFLNVYQGDCTIIQDSFSNKVMLVDTGGLKNYDIAEKKIIPYLCYQGIKKIDLVVITHHDYDHEGALESLKQKIPVKAVIDDVSLHEIQLGKLKFKNLNRYYDQFSDENNQSILLYGIVCGYHLLLTGDMDQALEQKLMEDYSSLPVDILKVAHHGSKYSSSEAFLNFIEPRYAIISVGAHNSYGHPHEETLQRLQAAAIEIYRTDQNGTIRVRYNLKDGYFLESAK